MLDLELFDLESYLVRSGISFSTSGKNISDDWIGVQCPFCSDKSNHLGIHKESKAISCWNCGETGTIVKYLLEVTQARISDILSDIEKYSSKVYRSTQTRKIEQSSKHYDIRNIVSIDENNARHKRYLKSRNFNPDHLEKTYKIMYSGPVGKYSNRIIIPIHMFGREISFTTRTIDDKCDTRYLAGKDEQVVMPVKDCIYNYDSINDTAIIVEGPFDVWNIGPGATCPFGVVYTNSQLRLLSEKVKRAFVLYDPEAEQMAEKLAYDIAIFIPDVEIIDWQFNADDPAEIIREEVKHLRQHIFGKIY